MTCDKKQLWCENGYSQAFKSLAQITHLKKNIISHTVLVGNRSSSIFDFRMNVEEDSGKTRQPKLHPWVVNVF